MTTKICSSCQQEKNSQEFHKSRNECKPCRAAKSATYYAANQESLIAKSAANRVADKQRRAARRATSQNQLGD